MGKHAPIGLCHSVSTGDTEKNIAVVYKYCFRPPDVVGTPQLLLSFLFRTLISHTVCGAPPRPSSVVYKRLGPGLSRSEILLIPPLILQGGDENAEFRLDFLPSPGLEEATYLKSKTMLYSDDDWPVLPHRIV